MESHPPPTNTQSKQTHTPEGAGGDTGAVHAMDALVAAQAVQDEAPTQHSSAPRNFGQWLIGHLR